MAIIKYILLGVIQGLTEFLPVSSSAHLVIFQDLLLGIKEHQLILDIVLHLGTLLALSVFLFKDLKLLLNKKILSYIILSTALTVLVVVSGIGFFESLFSSAKSLSPLLLITGVVLLATKKITKGTRHLGNLRLMDAFWLGLIQGFSVMPGLSRSGLTISGLLFRKVEKETAFKFSFLASIPAILGALVFKLRDFSPLTPVEFKYMAFGLFASFLSGLIALRILLTVIRKGRLHLFGYYCLGLALVLWRWLR